MTYYQKVHVIFFVLLIKKRQTRYNFFDARATNENTLKLLKEVITSFESRDPTHIDYVNTLTLIGDKYNCVGWWSGK